jgi:3-oxoacyl-[acyl-carrier protein] reductase
MPDKHGILPAKYFSSEESVDIVMAEGNLHLLFIGPLQTPIYQTVRARQDGRVAFVRSDRLEARAGCVIQRSLFTESKGEFMSKLAKKVALVTGGSRGIGAAVAKRLAADGASVAITYAKDAASASAVVKAIEAAGGKALAIQADAADTAAIKGAVEKTVATFGGLDVLVNNAGTAIPKRFEETTLEEMDRMIDINIRGVFIATQAALKHIKNGGRIIMIGSCVGERNLTPGLAAYSATKGAVKMFTQSLSREVGSRGITVNNVQPGPIDTDLNPASGDWATPQKAVTALNRYGHVDEVAALVSFVAGPESSYITGANLTVDGGTNA